jgi:hypothetical protein
MCTARAARVHGAGAARGRSARPALAGPASACAARDSAARRTPERSQRSERASWRGRRRCHSDGGGANCSSRAPTAVRVPTGHGEGENSSPELLVDGEGEKIGSATAFFRRGGAMVAGNSLAMGRREGT